MPAFVQLHRQLHVLLLAAAACATPRLTREVALTDEQALMAQELGEVSAPGGTCPDRTQANVLGNPRAPVQRTALGLAYCILEEGPPGMVPGPTDSVLVHYSGWTLDGRMFDSSVERGQPVQVAVNDVISGWTEGLRLMTPGDKARLWVPAHLGYGQHKSTAHEDTPTGTLVFDIELIEVQRVPPPTPEVHAAEAPVEPKRALGPKGSPAEKPVKASRNRDHGH